MRGVMSLSNSYVMGCSYSAEHELGHGAKRGEVAVDEYRRRPRLAPSLEVVADLRHGADQRDVLDHGRGDRRRGVVLAPVEVGVLNFVGRVLVAHAREDVEVEVHLLGPHAADVE